MAKKTQTFGNPRAWAQQRQRFLERLEALETRLGRLHDTRNHSVARGECTKIHTLFESYGSVFSADERRDIKKRLKSLSKTLGMSDLTKSTTHPRTLMNRVRRRQRVNVDGHVTKIESYLKNVIRSLQEFKATTFRSIPTTGPYASRAQLTILPRYKLYNFSRLRWTGGNVGRQRAIRVVLKSSNTITSTLNRYERAYNDVAQHALFSNKVRGATNRVNRLGREITGMIREMRDIVRVWERVHPQKRTALQRIYTQFQKQMYA